MTFAPRSRAARSTAQQPGISVELLARLNIEQYVDRLERASALGANQRQQLVAHLRELEQDAAARPLSVPTARERELIRGYERQQTGGAGWSQLSYRFSLRTGTRPGLYPWPLLLSVRAL